VLRDHVSTDLARTVFEASPDGMIVVDTDGVVRAANQAFATMFGCEVDEVVGSKIERFVPEADREAHVGHRQGYVHDPARREMGSGLRLFAQGADGDNFPAEVALSPVEVEGQPMTVATIRDVSERQESRMRIELAEERERIARDIHDMVIQRVFAAGMSIQALMSMVDSPALRDRLDTVTDELDQTIRELRNAIFRLGSLGVEQSLESQVRAVIEERRRHLGFAPTIVVNGSLDAVPAQVAEHLLATLTEALSNVARHANATRADVDITRTDHELALVVTDDGVGMNGTTDHRGGLTNLGWRAAELGGSFELSAAQPSGTRLSWRVPL